MPIKKYPIASLKVVIKEEFRDFAMWQKGQVVWFTIFVDGMFTIRRM
jgi:hypothetical protein